METPTVSVGWKIQSHQDGNSPQTGVALAQNPNQSANGIFCKTCLKPGLKFLKGRESLMSRLTAKLQ